MHNDDGLGLGEMRPISSFWVRASCSATGRCCAGCSGPASTGSARRKLRASEVDAARFIEVANRHGNITHAETKLHALHQHLAVEDEVVRVFFKRNGGQDFAFVGAKTGVSVTHVLAEPKVLDQRQSTVGQVLNKWHSALKSFTPSADSRAEHDIAVIQPHETDRQVKHPAVVLIVRMDHDDVVGTEFQSVSIAAFLVPAVSGILLMLDHLETNFVGQLGGLVTTAIVDEDDLINPLLRKIEQGSFQRFRCVVSGQDGNRSLTLGVSFGWRTMSLISIMSSLLRSNLPAWIDEQARIVWPAVSRARVHRSTAGTRFRARWSINYDF